jgi:hypothetical protein
MARTEVERAGRWLEEQGLLLAYTVKCLLVAAFLELLLYRLVSRLGMHLSKVAEKHEWVRATFKGLSSIGFTLLNFTALLAFLAVVLILLNRLHRRFNVTMDAFILPSVSLLLLLTVGFLIVPPAMLGSVFYNLLSFLVIAALVVDYVTAATGWRQRVMVLTFFLGISGWLYYQILSTSYGLLGVQSAPPLVHEVNRAGEAFMVLASILTFWAYAGTPVWSTNRRQQRRIMIFGSMAATAFMALLFLDYFLGLYDPAVATSVRKAGEGIGWIFQMGMGYTFYLPFALYVAGLLLWSYTVAKLVLQGRPAGYGLAFMFLAGYALQLSHLTLLVVLGLLLLVLDRRPAPGPLAAETEGHTLGRAAAPVFREQPH